MVYEQQSCYYLPTCMQIGEFNVCIHTEYILMVNRTGKVNMNEQQFRSKPYFLYT